MQIYRLARLLLVITKKQYLYFSFSFHKETDGGYGITVITRVCGTCNQGSIPCSHPYIVKSSTRMRWGLFDIHGYRESKRVACEA